MGDVVLVGWYDRGGPDSVVCSFPDLIISQRPYGAAEFHSRARMEDI
jgi:hypothetical protein